MRGTITSPNSRPGGLFDKHRVGRRIRHARQDRNQSVDTLATLVTELSGEKMTPQMIKNIESGRKRIDAAWLPIFAAVQRKSFGYYLLDDPSGYDLREAGVSRSNVVPLRKLDRDQRPISGRPTPVSPARIPA